MSRPWEATTWDVDHWSLSAWLPGQRCKCFHKHKEHAPEGCGETWKRNGKTYTCDCRGFQLVDSEDDSVPF